jgi:hypothetical protein
MSPSLPLAEPSKARFSRSYHERIEGGKLRLEPLAAA